MQTPSSGWPSKMTRWDGLWKGGDWVRDSSKRSVGSAIFGALLATLNRRALILKVMDNI